MIDSDDAAMSFEPADPMPRLLFDLCPATAERFDVDWTVLPLLLTELRSALASGAVDTWLGDNPDTELSRDYVAHFIASMQDTVSRRSAPHSR
jgi:hypothetical protein